MTVPLQARPTIQRLSVTVLTFAHQLLLKFLLGFWRSGYPMFTSPWAQKRTIKWISDGRHDAGPLHGTSLSPGHLSLRQPLPRHTEDYLVNAELASSVSIGRFDLEAGSYFRPTDTSIATESRYLTCDSSGLPPSSPVRQDIASFDSGDRRPALHDGMNWDGALPIPPGFSAPYPAPGPVPGLPDALPSTGGPDLPQTVPLHASDSFSAGYMMHEGSKRYPVPASPVFDRAPFKGSFDPPTHWAAAPLRDHHSPISSQDRLLYALPPSLPADNHRAKALDGATTRYDRKKQGPRKLVVATMRRQEASKSRRSTTSAAVYVCPFAPHCNSTFTRQFSLANHIRSHKNAREFTCPVEGCGKRFNTAALCSSHGKRCH